MRRPVKTLTTVAWVLIAVVFAFGVWAMSQPNSSGSTIEGRIGPDLGPITPRSVPPTTSPPVTVPVYVPQVVTVTVPTQPPVTPTTQPCLVYLVDRCVSIG